MLRICPTIHTRNATCDTLNMHSRLLFIWVLSALPYSAGGQIDSLSLENSFWINTKNEVISFGHIDNIDNGIRNSHGTEKNALILTIAQDTIILEGEEIRKDLFIAEVKEYKFLVQSFDSNALILKPISKSAIAFFESDGELKLSSLEAVDNFDGFDFESFIYEKKGYILNINTHGDIYLTLSEPIFWKMTDQLEFDESIYGEYHGRLSTEELRKLSSTLSGIGISRGMDLNNVIACSHCNDIKIEVGFNGKKIEYSFNYPLIATIPIYRFIYEVVKIENLEKRETRR